MADESTTTVAGVPSAPEAVPFDRVLDAELAAIAELRRRRGQAAPEPTGATATSRANASDLVALAFSGGGIRSATFNLGVIQALARLGLLRRFDILSTVSGGGYIGSWLTAWIRRCGIASVEASLATDQVRGEPAEPALPGADPPKLAEAEPVTFLRRFSNYLTPKVGLLTADTWTVVTTYLRNVLLNQTVLILALMAMLLGPRLVLLLSQVPAFARDAIVPLRWGVVVMAIGVFFIALNLVQVLRRPLGPAPTTGTGTPYPWFTRQGWVQTTVAVPLFAASWLGGLWLWYVHTNAAVKPGGREHFWVWEWLAERWPAFAGSPFAADGLEPVSWALVAAGVYLASWVAGLLLFLILMLISRRWEGAAHDQASLVRAWRALILASPLAGAVGGLLFYVTSQVSLAIREIGTAETYEGAWHLLHVNTWQPAAITVVFLLTAWVHTGLMGRAFPEALRQWWSRLGAWMLIYAIAWVSVFAVAFYGPILLVLAGAFATGAFSTAWLTTTVGAVLAGRRPRDPAEERPPLWHRALTAVGPHVFVAGLLALVALGLHAGLQPPAEQLRPVCQGWFWPGDGKPEVGGADRAASSPSPLPATVDGESPKGRPSGGGLNREQLVQTVSCHAERLFKGTSLPGTPIVLGLLGLAALVLSGRVDINQFSMHLFYRNRLIRAYLGASNPNRQAQPFTGFEPADDVPLAALSPEGSAAEPAGTTATAGYDGPYPIVNVTLNLVAGQELAWQERKASSFVFTPLYAGFDVHRSPGTGGQEAAALAPFAYRPTSAYDPHGPGVTLGTAVAISGAAVSPSMGSNSKPALAFLLTMFNVRLGWWLGNPRHEKSWSRLGPNIGLFALLAELFGQTDERSRYVYLSDGGHFENLALYELVRRRCRFIVACDAEADPEMTFGGLGTAIRRCRTDFGIEIDIDVDRLRRSAAAEPARWHCAVGTIRYDQGDSGLKPGTLVYLKASLTGDEPEDLRNYGSLHPEFPHESTADQWFAESQFESYRRLGEHVAERVLAPAGRLPDEADLEKLFAAWRKAWEPAKAG